MRKRIIHIILFLVLVLGLLTVATTLHATEASELEVTKGDIEGYITVKVNNTGIYYSVPAFNDLVNATYNGEIFGGYIVNSTCLYLYSYDIYNSTALYTRVSIYNVVNNVAYPIAELYITGYGYYCNSSLENSSIIMIVYHYNTTTIPFIVMSHQTITVTAPEILRPWLPLIAFALLAPVVIWFNLRKMAIGLIASGGFMILLTWIFGLTAPWYYVFGIIQIAIGLVLMYLVEKNPEMF